MKVEELIQNCLNEIEPTPTQEEYGVIDGNFNFRNFDGWDSLTALCIQVMVENKYGCTLSNEEIRNSKNFNDLFDLIKEKKGE